MNVIVPWTSTKEWRKVHELIYSGDVENLKKGTEMLRGWKARCTKLHAGLECTLIITEAMLNGHEIRKLPILRSYDVLTACYAIALTRFLNLASIFEKERACYSMYKIARRLNLPEWIVNIRHQSAHGHELPTYTVLETGLKLALDWLDKVYWKSGLQGKEWELSEDNSLVKRFQIRLSNLMKVYQELKFIQINSLSHEKESESLHYSGIIKEFLSPNDGDWLNGGQKNKSSEMQILPKTLRKCIWIILNKLLDTFKMAEKEYLDIGLLLDFFLFNSLFLPNEENIEDFDPQPDDVPNERLPRKIILMWKNVLEDVIFKGGYMKLFMEKLVNFKSGSGLSDMLAAIWIKQIAVSIKSTELIKNNYINESMGNRRMNFETRIRSLVAELKQRQPEQMWNLVFFRNVISVTEEFNLLAENVLQHPKKNCMVYIKELLELHSKPFSSQRKKLIIEAIKIKLELEDEANSIKMLQPGSTEMEKFCKTMVDADKDYMTGGSVSAKCEHENPAHNWGSMPLALHPRYHQHINIPSQIPADDQDELLYMSSEGDTY